MNLANIAEAIADLFDPASVTPPSGMTNIRVSSHRLPPAVTCPELLVFPPEMRWSHGASTRTGDLVFPVRFYVSTMAGLPRAIDQVYAWHDVLIERIVGQVMLGESAQGVTHARWMESRIGVLTYPTVAPDDEQTMTRFLGIETAVNVHVAEGMTYTA